MAIRSYQLTLAAAAQRLSNVYGGESLGNQINAAQDIPYRQLFLQATGANAFVGMDSLTTSTTYGVEVDAADLQPVILGGFDDGPLHLSDLWVAGAGATLHVLGIPF